MLLIKIILEKVNLNVNNWIIFKMKFNRNVTNLKWKMIFLISKKT